MEPLKSPIAARGCGRVGALFAALFFVPFAAIGSTFVVVGIRGFLGLGQNAHTPLAGNIVFTLVGLLFAVIGLAGIGGSLAVVFGFIRDSSRPSKRSSKTAPSCYPRHKPPTRSPRGAFALRPEVGRLAKSVGLWIAALFWNGFISIFFIAVFRDDDSPGFVLFILGIFGLVGLAIAWGAAKETLRYFLVPTTIVELNRERVHPGQSLTVRLYQAGRFSIANGSLILLCREEATYRVGSSSTTVKEVFWEERIASVSMVDNDPGRPLLSAETHIPAQAMHSFASSNNKIFWGIRLILEIPGRPDIDEFYPFLVEAPQ